MIAISGKLWYTVMLKRRYAAMLKELYHGKINPSEQILRPELTEMSQEWLRLSEEFEASLIPEQVEMYHRLSDIQSESVLPLTMRLCMCRGLRTE